MNDHFLYRRPTGVTYPSRGELLEHEIRVATETLTPAQLAAYTKPLKAGASPTQRSLQLLRQRGYTVQVVEHWNMFAKVRQDLLGFGDILAVMSASPITLVQTTTAGHMAERIAKIQAEPRAKVWTLAGGAILVHGWVKKGPRNGLKVWTCREEWVTL